MMRNFVLEALALCCAVGIMACSDEDGGAAAHSSFLYTVSNGSDNAIYGYSVDDDGALTALPGSPYATSGVALSMASFISGEPIITDRAQKFVFAVNPRSHSVAVMRIGKDGSLKPVSGSPFATGSDGAPNSLALSGDVLYVAHNSIQNDNCAGCELRGFRVDLATGSLELLEDATITQPEQPVSQPLAIAFDPKGEMLAVTHFAFEFESPEAHRVELYSFDRRSGRLEAMAGSPLVHSLERNNAQPLGIVFNPKNGSQLFIANNVNVPMETGTVSSYILEPGEGMSEAPGSPIATNQVNSAWLAMSSDGKHLYVANSAADTLSHFRVNADGSLRTGGIIDVLDNTSLDTPRNIVISADNRRLFTVNGRGLESENGGSIVGFTIDDQGELTRMPHEPPNIEGERPFGLVLVQR